MERSILTSESKGEADDGEFLRIGLMVEADEASRQDAADRVSAECWEVGAEGIEERVTDRGILLLIYVRRGALDEVIAAGESAGASTMGAPEPVRKRDWSEAWKEGLQAIVVSKRLLVRPSFVSADLEAGQQELLIDPGQAFGTGGHASTLLNLQWVDALSESSSPECSGFDPATRVLDIGTGTGVLALAALKLGAGTAVGFDLDPIAAREAHDWGVKNGMADRFVVFAGPLAALQATAFDLVLANLLSRELLPIVSELVDQVAESGSVVLSGLLANEQGRVESAFAPFGFVTLGAHFTRDQTGDHWVSLHMGRS